MSQIEVPKIHGWVAHGAAADSVAVTKVHGWVLLVPGSDSGDPPARQGFCYAQKVRRG